MKYLLIAFLYCLSNYAFSQQQPYKHFTLNEGLVGIQTMSLYEDSKGRIWVGTKTGVNILVGDYLLSIIGVTHLKLT